jgi:starch synthase (maltosyl-transferring)
VTPPLIYNLFQRLVGPITKWGDHARRAKQMEFNWLYLNPWHYPGFSGSLYAPKELRRINPLFLPPGSDEHSLEPLRGFLEEMARLEMPVMMDLVVNHTSKDSPLIEEHPTWYVRDRKGEVVSPSVTDPDDPTKVTVWGDLAEIDNAGSPDREALWDFWAELVRDSVKLGFAGFRCDAAYMVPSALWKRLIREARSIEPAVVFFAETLGAPEEDVLALREAGFDFFFNSSKWWNFSEKWALDQHARFGRIAPSISFPETHDTPRLAGETGGSEEVQRQRYAFAAAFSAGLMMPIGYEFGFRKQVDVVETMPSDWERRSWDLQPFVTRVNRLKLEHPVLQGEGRLRAIGDLEADVLVLERRVEGAAEPALIIVNKRSDSAGEVDLSAASALERARIIRVSRDESEEETGDSHVRGKLSLQRAEVVYILPR